nr:hypothetical protein [Tanacetum cinerariifolium]
CLGCGIIGLSRVAGLAHHRGDRDHPAEPRFHHRLGGGADQAEGGLKVDADHLIPLVVLHPHRQIVAGDAGVVDEDVELAAQ